MGLNIENFSGVVLDFLEEVKVIKSEKENQKDKITDLESKNKELIEDKENIKKKLIKMDSNLEILNKEIDKERADKTQEISQLNLQLNSNIEKISGQRKIIEDLIKFNESLLFIALNNIREEIGIEEAKLEVKLGSNTENEKKRNIIDYLADKKSYGGVFKEEEEVLFKKESNNSEDLLQNSNVQVEVKNISKKKEKIVVNKEQKIYIDLLKESKLDINNIQEFILNKSKQLEDPDELSTNDWKKVLNFGVNYKILTNREIQQLKQISLMLGNSGYKNERSEILNKVKENGFEISLYKVEDWEKLLEFLVETKGITKEVKDGFEGIFKKYKKKKMFKLEQLKFILPYLEKYKESIKIIEIESKDETLEIEEESCLTPFGKALNETYVEKKEYEKMPEIVTANIMESTEEKVEKDVTLAEPSNENIEELNTKILAVESDEWQRIKCWLRENNILDCNHQKKAGYYNFCDTLNESKRFDKKLTTGQMIKAREIYTILEGTGYFSSKKEEKIVDTVTSEVVNDSNEKDQIGERLIDDEGLLEKVKSFKGLSWIQLGRWAKNNSDLGRSDLKKIMTLASTRNERELTSKELVMGLELYFLLLNVGLNPEAI